MGVLTASITASIKGISKNLEVDTLPQAFGLTVFCSPNALGLI
jgi:hypothetical protein